MINIALLVVLLFSSLFSVKAQPSIDDELASFALPNGGSIRVSYHVDEGGTWLLFVHTTPTGWDSAGFYQLPVSSKPDSWNIAACGSSVYARLYWRDPPWSFWTVAPLQEDSGLCAQQSQGVWFLYFPVHLQ